MSNYCNRCMHIVLIMSVFFFEKGIRSGDGLIRRSSWSRVIRGNDIVDPDVNNNYQLEK